MNTRFATASLFGIVCSLIGADGLRAQTAPTDANREAVERLRRDQEEILRKAERLQALMQRLLTRYQRENKKEQVALLEQGLQHLEGSAILRDVASIREDLAATALTEALRKQRDVVDDLERLLNILLERKSIESLDQELQQVAEQAKTARELERRQQELIDATQQALQNEPTAAERELLAGLQSLRDAERREAERNARQAGAQRPFLESALDRVRELLRQQDGLEKGLEAENNGKQAESRAREFDLRGLAQRTSELQTDLRDQLLQQQLEEAARELQKASEGSDQGALQQARDRLLAMLQTPPKRAGVDGRGRDADWAKLQEELAEATAGPTPAEREQLKKLGDAAESLAQARQAEARQTDTATSAAREKEAAALAKELQPAAGETNDDTQPGAQVEKARQQLAEAKAATERGDNKAATEKVEQAMAAMDKALAAHREQHPDSARQAAKMAAESAATADELRNAPEAGDPEQRANEQLHQATQAQREVERQVEEARDAGQRPDAQKAAAASRQALEQAKQTLEQALNATSEDTAAERQDAQARQEQLRQAAESAKQQLGRAAQQGQLTKEQQAAAAKKLDDAQQQMQAAGQRLEQGQQASAAKEQMAAAESVQQAMDAIQQQKPMTEAQRQQLAEQAKAQEQLADDILRLAEELKKRENKAAERSAQQAAGAAKKAKQAMEQGDEEEAQKQQEEAREKLEQAAEELEEEKDRYQDLRQEELLFRMRDELTTMLEQQRPITVETLAAQKSSADGLSRPARIKLKQLGEQEQALATKVQFLVTALADDGNLVYQAVLKANADDLDEIARRLSGRAPDPGPFTTLMQQDVERRTEDLLAALERERQRREKERQEQQQQEQQKGENRFNPQRERLVSLIAELEMLKKLGTDTRRSTDDLGKLIELRSDDSVSPAELALIERLGHRHAEITKLFQAIKKGVEETLQAMQGDAGEEGGRGR